MEAGAIHTVAIGSDHAGYALKTAIADFLRESGYEVTDVEPTPMIGSITRTSLPPWRTWSWMVMSSGGVGVRERTRCQHRGEQGSRSTSGSGP